MERAGRYSVLNSAQLTARLCRYGHELFSDNLKPAKRGGFLCLQCRLEADRDYEKTHPKVRTESVAAAQRRYYEANKARISARHSAWQKEHRSTITRRYAESAEFQTKAIWRTMIFRCYNQKADSYERYGGRGISVCNRWKNSSENFITDMGLRPPGMTIERKDNLGSYCPENCIWADLESQGRNKRNSWRIFVAGRELLFSEAMEVLGLTESTLRRRIREGLVVGLKLYSDEYREYVAIHPPETAEPPTLPGFGAESLVQIT